MAVVDITNHGSTVQTVNVLANGTAVVTGSGTGTHVSTWTLQPGEMQAFSFPINPEKYGNVEGQCWSFPFAVKAASNQPSDTPAPVDTAAETSAAAAEVLAAPPAEPPPGAAEVSAAAQAAASAAAAAASESAQAEAAASASAEAASPQQRALLARTYTAGAYSVTLSPANPINTTTTDLLAEVTSHDSNTGLARQFGLAITLLNADGSVNASGTLCAELLGGTSQQLEFAPQQGTMLWTSIRVSTTASC
ncbi:hypothetical protein [Kitasatospora arboriphila]|uniref:hypothetical protein n=1 Tax=Kitasatospora arboriphila TaxID=258052 RepID=UPI0031DCC0C8